MTNYLPKILEKKGLFYYNCDIKVVFDTNCAPEEEMTENTEYGRIIKGIGGLYTVLTKNRALSCRARGIFRHENDSPRVGDIVSVKNEDGSYVIEKILPRKNLFMRPPLANVDFLFCVIPCASPQPDIFTLDKLISISESLSCEPVIVVTKSDLDAENASRIMSIYSKAFQTFLTSSCKNTGTDELLGFIERNSKNSVFAFAGASGAGKSTLMNKLFPCLSISTQSVSRKISRGRHTTRHVELFPLRTLGAEADGFIADTPGFSMLDFERFDFYDVEQLPLFFREFSGYLGKCRYKGCTHLCEQGCAIVEAVEKNEIPKSRHESFVALYNVLKNKNKWDKKHSYQRSR